ncbi:MAG TPA: zinc ABC transporter substrate-binding protein [Thermoanaerobaculia bacterium]|nr:zinc ABC transporter substrate-binding protein [Thermoanaerobaculia bacterium]
MRALIGALLALLACRSAPGSAPDGGRLRVAVSVPPQAWFVERIGGDRVSVEVMIPPGFSHVDYPLTPRQLTALAATELYVEVGHPAFDYEQRYVIPYLKAAPRIRVVDMSRGMRFIAGEEGNGDPHVWVAPETVAVAAGNIARALEAADPAGAPVYRANLRSFLTEIGRLDREIRALLAGTPNRRFIVFHPSWGYFAHEYGLEQIAIEAEGKEPSAARMIQLIDRARRERVRVVFIEGGFPRKSAQVIADAIGGRVVTADPQLKDWPDNLRHVAAALREAPPHA